MYNRSRRDSIVLSSIVTCPDSSTATRFLTSGDPLFAFCDFSVFLARGFAVFGAAGVVEVLLGLPILANFDRV